MQFNLTGRHIDITDAMRAYVTKKLARVERHYDHIISLRVVLAVDKVAQSAEAIAHVGHGQDIFADAAADDLYAAIDALVDKLDRQLIRHKEKLADHRLHAGDRGVAR